MALGLGVAWEGLAVGQAEGMSAREEAPWICPKTPDGEHLWAATWTGTPEVGIWVVNCTACGTDEPDAIFPPEKPDSPA